MIQQIIWSLDLLPFLNPACSSGNSQFMYCWSLAWRIFSITFLAGKVSTTVPQFEHSLALPFFGNRMKIDLFQFCSHCWVFQICWMLSAADRCTSKLQWGHCSSVDWSSWKSLQTKNAVGGEEREPSYTPGGNVNWRSHYGEHYGAFLQN